MKNRGLHVAAAVAALAMLFQAPASAGGPAAGAGGAAEVEAVAGVMTRTAPERSESLLRESRLAVQLALRWLSGRQAEDGSWHGMPAITALTVSGMLRSGLDEFGPGSGPVRRGLAYIRSAAREDGGIYIEGYANYNTAFSAMALAEAGLEEDEPVLWRAREYLLGLQAVEANGIDRDNWMYGGWGYEPHADREGMHTADMSNTHITIEALTRLQQAAERNNWPRWSAAAAAEGGDPLDAAMEKALVFLTRCQNLRQTNPLPRTGNDGGFRYRPHETRADGQKDGEPLLSYGSISYAGAKSLLFAGLPRDDARVRGVADYIHRNWTVKENPGLGGQSLYYYYMAMSQCLNAFGAESVAATDGVLHDWRTELAGRLIDIQSEDSAWRNDEHRWLERLPELTTAYAVLAMTNALESW